ncbi:uncharacterized protein VP01_15369g1, partial [Puccinia sorghi]
AQQECLDSVLASMRNMINTKLEPVPDGRTDLQKALDDDYYLNHINIYYNGVMEEARFLKLPQSEMPDIYALW